MKEGLRLWLRGQTTSRDCNTYIRPFRRLTRGGLPGKVLQNKLRIQWAPIFRYLEDGVSAALPRDTANMTVQEIGVYYDKCVEFLRERVSYCFAREKGGALAWSTATWANKIQRSSVLKYGTDADKSFLKVATKRNNPHRGATRKRKRALLEFPKYPERQKRRQEQGRREVQLPNDERTQARPPRVAPADETDEFARAFSGIEVDEATRAPSKEVLDEVREELRVARTAERNMAVRNATLFINPLDSRRQLHRNYGDNSAISRQRYGEQTLAAAIDGRGTGHRLCAIVGCTRNDLTPTHSCYRNGCNKLLHNLCAQANNLSSNGNELNMYCSTACKGND